MKDDAELIRHPFSEAPDNGTVREVAPGVLWLRLPLPYALDHVNLYLFEEGDGWALFDTGLGDDVSRECWDRLLRGPLGGKPIVRLVVSHFHPDHVGLAGWLHERFAPPLHMTQSEYFYAKLLQQGRDPQTLEAQETFYQTGGLSPDEIQQMLGRGLSYLNRTTGLAPSFERMIPGQTMRLGGRDWRILTGGGHSPEQAMLYCAADRLFLAADQVIARISPNVSVSAMQPKADPLGLYLSSLAAIREEVAADSLVLSGHRLPFYGLDHRTRALEAHHVDRCAQIAEACRAKPLSCKELVPVLFRRALDSHQLSFAFGEALAHINHMVGRGELRTETRADGVLAYHSA